MMPTKPSADPAPDTIRPLKDVWLRPRRVFRELAGLPLSVVDYVLASVPGIANFLTLHRTQPMGGHVAVGEILMNSLVFGSIFGVASTYLLASVYVRLGARAGRACRRAAVFHVLAYGGIPVVAGLGIWALAIILIGDVAFLAPPAESDGFTTFILPLQVVAYVFLLLWSVVLQVMGFSELQSIATSKAFGVWLLGQSLWMLTLLGMVVVLEVIAKLLPGLPTIPTT